MPTKTPDQSPERCWMYVGLTGMIVGHGLTYREASAARRLSGGVLRRVDPAVPR